MKFTTFLLLIISFQLQSQDTIRYVGMFENLYVDIVGNDPLIEENFILYNNGIFKRTNESKLIFEEFGEYILIDDKLILRYYSEMRKPDSVILLEWIPDREEVFITENNQLYRINRFGKKIKRRKISNVKGSIWEKLFGFKYSIKKN